MVVVVVQLNAVEADVVGVAPRGQQLQLEDDWKRGQGVQTKTRPKQPTHIPKHLLIIPHMSVQCLCLPFLLCSLKIPCQN